jgi:uncharacterized protein YprB with RNaseH-like and TPR domain
MVPHKFMLNLTETQKLLQNTRLHWVVKANVVRSYIDEFGLDGASRDLILTRKTIDEYHKLAKYMQFFPTLKDIPDKAEALRVLKYNEGDSVQLRKMIALTAARFKTKLMRSAIKQFAQKEPPHDGPREG